MNHGRKLEVPALWFGREQRKLLMSDECYFRGFGFFANKFCCIHRLQAQSHLLTTSTSHNKYYLVNMDQNLWGMVPALWWICVKAKGGRAGYQIKWPVSVYCMYVEFCMSAVNININKCLCSCLECKFVCVCDYINNLVALEKRRMCFHQRHVHPGGAMHAYSLTSSDAYVTLGIKLGITYWLAYLSSPTQEQ